MCSISVPVKEELRIPAPWVHEKYENSWGVHIFYYIKAPHSPLPPPSSSSKSMKIVETFMFFCYIEAPNSPPHPFLVIDFRPGGGSTVMNSLISLPEEAQKGNSYKGRRERQIILKKTLLQSVKVP